MIHQQRNNNNNDDDDNHGRPVIRRRQLTQQLSSKLFIALSLAGLDHHRSNAIMNDQEKWTPLTTFITPFAAFHESFIHYAYTFSVYWSELIVRLPAVVVVTVVAGRQNIEFGAGWCSEEQGVGRRQQITLSGCRAVHIDDSPAMLCLQWHKIEALLYIGLFASDANSSGYMHCTRVRVVDMQPLGQAKMGFANKEPLM